MARIAGIDLPKKKRAEIGLTYIHGIGRTSSRAILTKAGVDLNKKVDDLNDDEVSRIRSIITGEYKVEGSLRSEVGDEHQAVDGHRLLSGDSPPQGTSRARSAYADQRPHAKGRRKTVAGKKKTAAKT